MPSAELRDGVLAVDREPTRVDDVAVRFSACLRRCDVTHAYVSDYVPHLAGRTRRMDSIEVLIQVLDEETAESLGRVLDAEGFWSGPLPVSSLYEMLTGDAQVWIAPAESVTPHVDVTVVGDEFDSSVLDHAITGKLTHGSVPISPVDLQIAYKLHLDTKQDFADAAHLYSMFAEDLHTERLEAWVSRLGVEDAYSRLPRY